MLSYILITGACALLFWRVIRGRPDQSESDYGTDDDSDLVQAIARYEAPQWKMAVATNGQMSQKEWDRTLTILTSNIRNLESI